MIENPKFDEYSISLTNLHSSRFSKIDVFIRDIRLRPSTHMEMGTRKAAVERNITVMSAGWPCLFTFTQEIAERNTPLLSHLGV